MGIILGWQLWPKTTYYQNRNEWKRTFSKEEKLFQILEESVKYPKVQMVTSYAVTEGTGFIGEKRSLPDDSIDGFVGRF